MSDLTGKTALVTGASGDIGRAIALALAAEGATVYATARRLDKLEALAEEAGGRIVPLEMDLADVADVEVLGAIDILVLNAAHAPERAPFLKGGMETLRSIMEVNFFGQAALIERTLAGMVERRWGRLIHISSVAASIGEAHGPSYCASKAAMDGLFRNLTIDYSPYGVTVNSIEPGPILTERFTNFWGPVKARRFSLTTAVRRLGAPEDVANAVCFLASPKASYVTGEVMRVDGGIHLGNPMATMYIRQGRDD